MKPLVLFDIDGTLIHSRLPEGYVSGPSSGSFAYALQKVYGISDTIDWSVHDGGVSHGTAWSVVSRHGISREEFEARVHELPDAMLEVIRRKPEGYFSAIGSASALLEKLSRSERYLMWVITGNFEKIARYKLDKAGLSKYFPYGLYGDHADTRIDLARTVYAKRDAVAPGTTELTVVGDTGHDIAAGKAIGAFTIGLLTGNPIHRNKIMASSPDILAESLDDPRILDYFGLSGV